MSADNRKLRLIPAIDRLVAVAAAEPDMNKYPRNLIIACLRKVTDQLRTVLVKGDNVDTSPEALVTTARQLLEYQTRSSLRKVINATGVVLHTNLGRAPLGRRAIASVSQIMEGYSTLEYNINSGERGSRYEHVAEKLRQLTGAEDVLIVNNNAAAVLLVLSSVARGREVIVSRGELVEIGGSFRIPDVLKQSGAVLVEVGTTNKTHLGDYEQAIGPNTAAILKVHTSNYCIVGFTSQPDGAGLAALAHKHRLPVIEDLGSGTLRSLAVGGQTEPSVIEQLALGFDLVTFSCDKLLGAGQGGIIAGKAEYIHLMKTHPLLRAVRIDKLSLAALEGTLQDYMAGDPWQDIPVLAMLTITPRALKERAEGLYRLLVQQNPLLTCQVVALNSPVGGGALPAAVLTGYGVAVTLPGISAGCLESRLRQREMPIVVRIQDERVIFDVRCLAERDLPEIAAAFKTMS
ncbi:L-seryl-tRNA(Sec) selenium transferase [Sporomusa termitida]|uniref:L-seryl-tRNA(Sec) selenium transferase n=1 Tax=Sporomusa termitida TaxID=2377 RepID=A0A517E0E7_9FIRM|nr:L-seryl-tRNA(Sec) selenium transferase [Sporomusa termitida]QDR83072.1 L-seryl-tRNA(Sec) selenium transferase [Sporomusa termitida]